MRHFTETAEAIAGTTSKLKKISFLATYLRSLEEPDLRAAAVFFTGRPFALTDSRTLNVGASALVTAVQQLSGASDEALHKAYSDRGDLGEAAENLLAGASPFGRGWVEGPGEGLSPDAIQTKLAELVKLSGASNKLPLILDLVRALN